MHTENPPTTAIKAPFQTAAWRSLEERDFPQHSKKARRNNSPSFFYRGLLPAKGYTSWGSPAAFHRTNPALGLPVPA